MAKTLSLSYICSVFQDFWNKHVYSSSGASSNKKNEPIICTIDLCHPVYSSRRTTARAVFSPTHDHDEIAAHVIGKLVHNQTPPVASADLLASSSRPLGDGTHHASSSARSLASHEAEQDATDNTHTLLLRIPDCRAPAPAPEAAAGEGVETGHSPQTIMFNWRPVREESLSDVCRRVVCARRKDGCLYFRATFSIREQIQVDGVERAEVVFSRATGVRFGMLPARMGRKQREGAASEVDGEGER